MARAARMNGFGLYPSTVASPTAVPATLPGDADAEADTRDASGEAEAGSPHALLMELQRELEPEASHDDLSEAAEAALREALDNNVTRNPSGVLGAGASHGMAFAGVDGVRTMLGHIVEDGAVEKSTDADVLAAAGAVPPASAREDGLPERIAVTRGPVELAVAAIPARMQGEFSALFVGCPEDVLKNLRVLTVAQRTMHSMSVWGSEIAAERERANGQFHEAATRLVAALKAAGHWADYVDPATGAPAFGPPTTEALVENDDRYSQFGFSVLDYGCCKALSHPGWGTHVFVGSVFTDAPVDEPLLKELHRLIA